MIYRFSRERATHLANLLSDELQRQPSVRLLRDADNVRQSILHALFEELRHDEERQAAVLQKIRELPDAPPPGSKDWDALFRRLLDEEYERHGFDIA
jgi:hypothetical protein